MAGIYVHVPFCKVKCHYCDFHFSVQLKNRAALIASICNELVIRQNYIGDEPVRTIYFGGGTPTSISTGNADDNGYGNFEYSPNITGDGAAKSFYALNTKNIAEFG